MRIGYTELYDGARRHWNQYEVAGIYAKGAGPCRIRRGAAPRGGSRASVVWPAAAAAPRPTPRSMR